MDTTNGNLHEKHRKLKKSLLSRPNSIVEVQSTWDGINLRYLGDGK
ncbi:MAG TPA: hypothetical protein PK604_01655 [Acetivibrio clariflavus]|nr:hypothetical protein [Acetivibrio clariflavus]HPU41235.1 hypothetical protein [Acetivibrio clariflavus]